MSEYIMDRKSLKRHCEAMCKKFKAVPTSGTYGEHRLVLNLLEQTEWIPIKWHNITEEEREREGYPKEWLTILDCQMPNDDEEVLITVNGKNGNLYVETDTCYFDGICYSSDNGYDWIDDVIAWMPLPKPYAESEEE